MYSKQTHMPATALHTIPITWPFAVWGLDMVGPLKTAPSRFTHLLVAVDKFTKWVEAKLIRKLDGKTALKFIKDTSKGWRGARHARAVVLHMYYYRSFQIQTMYCYRSLQIQSTRTP
jgi:hypothetical protein